MNELVAPFGLDPKLWAEVYKLLDFPIIAAIVIVTAQLRPLVPRRFWPVLPVALAMLVAAVVPSSFPLTVWNYWRRVAVYGGVAALAWNCRKIWLKPLPGGHELAEDGTKTDAAPPG